MLLGVFGILLAIITVLAFSVNSYWSPILAKKLKTTILSSTDSLYSMSFSNARLNVLEGKIIIDNIELKPNIDIYNRKKKNHIAPNSLYTLQLKRLVITHIHPLKLYFSKKLDINQIVFSEPHLHIDYEQNRDQDTLIKDKKTPYQLISKVLKAIHVQNIMLNDVKVKYVDHTEAKPDIEEFDQVNINATDFLLDSTSQKNKARFLFCKDVSAELNNYEGTSDGKLYKYKIKQFRFSTFSSQLNVTGISFLPIASTDDFFKNTSNDRFVVGLDSLRLNNFDFKTYSKYHKLYASSLLLAGGKISIQSNPAPADTSIDNSRNFPQLMLKNLKMDLRIDTVLVNKLGVNYTEYNQKSGQPGAISFDNINGRILNITNNKTALQKSHVAVAQLQAYFMNSGKLDAQFEFNLNDENTPFTFRGTLGAIDLKQVNPVTMPLALIKIASGSVKKLDFDIHANKKVSKGTLTLLYNNLKISLLKRGADDKLKKMGIVSLLANAMIIKRDNPMDQEPIRSANIIYYRRASASFFSFMWKSIFTGLKESVGFDARTERTIAQKIGQFKQNKLSRQARKTIRKQKRFERRKRRELRKQRKHAQSLQGNPQRPQI